MTLVLLLSLIYGSVGGLTALLVRTIGMPHLLHMCDSYEGCPDETRYTWLCPRRRIGGKPISLFGWAAMMLWWPAVWVYGCLYYVARVVSWVGSQRF